MRRFRRVLAAVLALVALTAARAQAATFEWRTLALPLDKPMVSNIAYGAGRFVMMAGDTLRTSTDGVTWTDVPLDLNEYFGSVHIYYTGKEFVALGCTVRCDTILTSADGLSWELRSHYYTVAGLDRFAYGNGRYLLTFVSSFDTLTSTDLEEWTRTPQTTWFQQVVFGQGLFVGAEWSGGRILTSPDGVEWTVAFQPDQPIWIYDLAYGDGLFVAVGETDPVRQTVVLTSTDGKDWTLQVLDGQPSLKWISYGNGLFFASGPDALAISDDGANWEIGPNPAGQPLAVIYGAGRFMAVTSDGALLVADVCGTLFDDVPAGTPWCDAVEDLATRGIVAGIGPRTFAPDKSLTRAELTTLLVRALGAAPIPDQSLPFADTAGHWAAEQGYLQAAVALGLISGFPDGTFRPDDPVTRAQIARLVVSAAGLTPEGEAPYADVAGDAWFAGWVGAAHRAGLIGLHVPYAVWGENAAFAADQPVTRAEAAMVLANLLRIKETE